MYPLLKRIDVSHGLFVFYEDSSSLRDHQEQKTDFLSRCSLDWKDYKDWMAKPKFSNRMISNSESKITKRSVIFEVNARGQSILSLLGFALYKIIFTGALL